MKRIMMYLSILLLIAAFPSINCIAQRSEINRIAEELERCDEFSETQLKKRTILQVEVY